MAVDYHAVGDLRDASDRVKRSISGWRLNSISTTRLASLIPLAVTLVWLAILVASS